MLAYFSDIVDSFTVMNMTKEQAFDLLKVEMGEQLAREKVQAGEEDHKPWTVGVKGTGLERWNHALKQIERRHGAAEVAEVVSYDKTGEVGDEF